jgi:hypothetical protein
VLVKQDEVRKRAAGIDGDSIPRHRAAIEVIKMLQRKAISRRGYREPAYRRVIARRYASGLTVEMAQG